MKSSIQKSHDLTGMLALRRDILDSPEDVALHRARVFTRVWQENEGAPWIVLKEMALREYFRTVPLYIRRYDRIAGSISEKPGAMPVYVELGIAENNIYTNENPDRQGYLRGKVPKEIIDYWIDRNLWGQYRAWQRVVHGRNIKPTEQADYKFISNQGHLSPSYRELLAIGLNGILECVRKRRQGEVDPMSLEFLVSAEQGLLGVIEWAERYGEFLANGAEACQDATRRDELREMSRICMKVAHEAPSTFREAMQIIWFVHQAIHIEGHGYSCTPDRMDQILYPFYLADKKAGRIDEDLALTLCENFILKQRDNTFWGVEHNLTQGLVVSGSTPEGKDQTNELSWLFITAAGNMSVPEPLVWLRWHPDINPDFFDHCLANIARRTCFPLMMSDTAVPFMFMELGVKREDAFNYVPVGCNELAILGQAYFNPCAGVNYLGALEQVITDGKGYKSESLDPARLPKTFKELVKGVGKVMRYQIERSYAYDIEMLHAQMQWGQTPLTSCFFDGCIERSRDMIQGTKYNILTCGGVFFSNMVDCLAAIREVVYEKKEATLSDVAAACKANFKGYEELRQKLLAAPKHGNDDPRLDDIIAILQRLRDEPVKAICRDPRDGRPFGNVHLVRSSAVRVGAVTGATPDGRLAGTPLASSVAASAGMEKKGPTALLNSILKLDPVKSWQSGYNVNLRLQHSMLSNPESREKVALLLRSYFLQGGQEMQINAVDSDTLRAAQKHPEEYGDLVIRVAGFSAFFISLTRDIQEDIIARTEYEL